MGRRRKNIATGPAVLLETLCEPWSGAHNNEGYPVFSWSVGGKRFFQSAHRRAYEQAHGPIPFGMTVDHLCFFPSCVNPLHLRLLTRSQNAANNLASKATHCINGHEYTPENTYHRPPGVGGQRDCRACVRARVARYKQRKWESA